MHNHHTFPLRYSLLILLFFGTAHSAFSQAITDEPRPPVVCFGPGSTPTTAILLCDKGTFIQDFPLRCLGGKVKVPNHCRETPLNPPMDTEYEIFSPVYYRFKCYVSGTFGFVISPIAPEVNLDWQLYDITNKQPDFIRTTAENVIAGNWSTTPNHTGTENPGLPFVVCKPTSGAQALSPYSDMPNLLAGHEYLLLVANISLSMKSFRMAIEGGTADIRDPLAPHLDKAMAECNGTEIIIRLNKEIQCSSLTPTGSEFKIFPAGPVITAARSLTCNSNLDFTELTLTLSSRLTDGNYKVVINNGSDGNTLLDFCNVPILPNEEADFSFVIPKPILADSIGKPDCTPDSVRIYFPKKISCASISPDGSDFSISGPQAATVITASGNCKNGKTDYVIVKFDKPITTKGNYHLTLKAGTDGSVIIDECGEESPPQTIDFSIADTVDAAFSYSSKLGCQRDTFTFSHNGAHDVNNWRWIFNKKAPATIQTPTVIWPASGTNEIQLLVSNGTCVDSAEASVVLDNEVKSIFSMPDMICPEDKLEVINNSIGIVDAWRWNFDVVTSSNLKDPPPFLMPYNNRETYYTVKLVAYNNTIGCSDSTRNLLTVLDNCLIAIPTAFTPNNDGLNDTFSPHNALKADNLVFKVYNRWGQLIFQSRTWRDKWDGKVNGVLQTTGVYVWMLSYINRDTKKQVFQKGTVALIR